MLGSPILYLKGMRILMFQLSGFCFRLKRILPRFPLRHPSRQLQESNGVLKMIDTLSSDIEKEIRNYESQKLKSRTLEECC